MQKDFEKKFVRLIFEPVRLIPFLWTVHDGELLLGGRRVQGGGGGGRQSATEAALLRRL